MQLFVFVRIGANRNVFSFDCTFEPVLKVLNDVKTYCGTLLTYDPELKYNLVLPTCLEGSIQSIERKDDGWDFERA